MPMIIDGATGFNEGRGNKGGGESVTFNLDGWLAFEGCETLNDLADKFVASGKNPTWRTFDQNDYSGPRSKVKSHIEELLAANDIYGVAVKVRTSVKGKSYTNGVFDMVLVADDSIVAPEVAEDTNDEEGDDN